MFNYKVSLNFYMLFISRQYWGVLLPSLMLSLTPSPIFADVFSKSIAAETVIQKSDKQSQQKINYVDDLTRKMLEQYRSASRQAKTLHTYNDHLKQLLTSQETEKESLALQLQQIEVTQQEIVPLILNMQKSLEEFVRLDIPFLPKERQQRLVKLKAMIPRADITNAEKFRRIIEAYQIENDYGNTIEAYRADIELQGKISTVDFLRLGRVSLYYQRLDGSETGIWDAKQKKWHALSNEYQGAIRQGLRIARKEVAPDLLTLPVPAAIEVTQ